LRSSRIVLVLNVLIAVSVLASVAVLGLIVVGGAGTAQSFSVGSPTTSTAGGVTRISVPITLTNRGYFSLSGIDVQLTVSDSSGARLINGTVGPVAVSPGQTETFDAALVLDTSKLTPAELQALATTSQNLTVSATLSASEPPFVGVSGAVTASLKWGAPVSGLKEGAPTFSQYNSTTIEASVPVSFTNANAYYTISGEGSIAILNSGGGVVGTGSVSLDVPPGASFDQAVDLLITLPAAQAQSLLTQDQTLSYTAVLSVQTGGGGSFSIRQPVTYAWGAPLAGLSVGAPQVSAYNSTAFQVSVPVSFTDNSSSIAVSTELGARIFNSTDGALAGSGTLAVQASPGGSFSKDMVIYVKVPSSGLQRLLFNDATLDYTAQLSGTSGGVSFELSKSVSVAWGAPVGGLAVGAVTITPKNSTYSSISAPFSFTDASTFLAVQGSVSGYVTDSSGNQVGTIAQTSIGPVQPGTQLSGALSGVVLNSAAGDSSFVLHLTFQTPWGGVTTEVTVAG
jgi:hypothetical protein